MEMKLRKLLPLAGALFATAFAPAFAHSNYGSSDSSSGSSYGSNMGSSNNKQQGTYQRGTFREITPNAGPRVAHGADVFITANFIWWKATQEGLNYAMSGVASAGDFVNNRLSLTGSGISGKGNVNDPDFGWDPGFKVGLGLNLSHDGWDIYAQYTWLHASDKDTTRGIAITNGIPAALGDIAANGLDVTRSADWDLHFNVIDLELGRNFYISQFLMLRPHFGFKGTWQEQDFKVTVSSPDGFTALNASDRSGPFRSRQDHDVWGVGVRAGLNTAWHFTTSWSIFGNVAWTAMWSHYDVDRKDTLRLTDDANVTPGTFTFTNTELDNYRVKYVGELEIGLRWEIWFYDDNYHFAMQAGWEEQVWLNYGNFIRLYNDTQGDLSLHGLNLKFRFDF